MSKKCCLILSISVLCQIICASQDLDIKKDNSNLREVLFEKRSAVKTTLFSSEQTNCVLLECSVICLNGRINQIEQDIHEVFKNSQTWCTWLHELRLYNYYFPNDTIYSGFLGAFGARVINLYIASANVTDVQAGAFGNGIFQRLSFENLQLNELRKDFFANISSDFTSLTIKQKQIPLRSICNNFLDHVKYQIRQLVLQIGVGAVSNLTSSDNLLNNLRLVDFSYNNLSTGLTASTFNKLSVVEELNLSHSEISYLPTSIFADADLLVLLDLSHNHLHTISTMIFGFQICSKCFRELKILLNDNYWECSCNLSNEMKKFFAYQQGSKVFCNSPEIYQGWSVTDERLCKEYNNASKITTTKIPNKTYGTTISPSAAMTEQSKVTVFTTVHQAVVTTPPSQIFPTSSSNIDTNNVYLQCRTGAKLRNTRSLLVRWPCLHFILKALPPLTVDVLIQSVGLNSSFRLMWFTKVDKKYYKMEVNYNEYGLGCYSSLSYLTTVENLLPAASYTFCLVLKDNLNISPFSCKSIHVGGNVAVSYSAWATGDMRMISLVIFGIVMCAFVGILIVFVLLKHKPTLLKGSKRVATRNAKSGEIVVFPKNKTMQDFRHKEEMLSKQNSRSTISCIRRSSTGSIDSNESYMNANFYEVIPAYLRLNEQNFSTDEINAYPQPSDLQVDKSFLLPLNSNISSADLLHYADIPYRNKHISSYPLPRLPTDQAPLSLAKSECSDRSADKSLDYIMILDSQV